MRIIIYISPQSFYYYHHENELDPFYIISYGRIRYCGFNILFVVKLVS